MLDFMRRNANSWVMIVLFAIIVFVFAINFGPWAGTSMASVPYAAVVNNEAISMAEFRTAYASQFARIKQFRPDYDQSQADKDGLKQMVLEQLISRELLTQLGQSNQFSVGAKTLAEEIKERVFGKDGEFNKDEYIRRVSSFFQSTIAQFEQQVAKELVAEQMANLLGTSVYVSEEEAKMSFQDKNTKVALEFIKVNPEHFKSTKDITAEDIKRFQEANGQKINDYYNEHIGSYVKEEEFKASHILVKVPAGSSAPEKAALKEKAQKIHTRVKNSEDFAEVAKAESDDTGTKSKGGDLGYFTPGQMVEEFSRAVAALNPGEISEVVESPFGFHVIRLTDKKPKMERTLADASAEIAELLMRKDEKDQKAMQLANSALEQLKNGTSLDGVKVTDLVYAKGGKQPSDKTAPIADETDLFSKTTPFINKIGRTDGLAEEAFKLTKDNATASKVLTANGELFAIRLKSRQDADMTKFEEQKDSIKMSLLFPRKRAFIQQFLTELKGTAKIKYNNTLMSGTQTAEL